MRLLTFSCLASVIACGDPNAGGSPPPRAEGEQPPVVINAESPVVYPVALYEQQVEGDVLLQLWISPAGVVDPDSVWVAESSGYPDLDSAAVQAAPSLRYAPATRDGEAVGIRFLQPIQFRHPDTEQVDGE